MYFHHAPTITGRASIFSRRNALEEHNRTLLYCSQTWVFVRIFIEIVKAEFLATVIKVQNCV